MKIKLLLLLSALVCTATFTSAQYTLITAEGVKQGKFKGESARTGASTKIDLLAFQFEVKVPKDAATGASTGKRQYQPITLWKATGAASPQFLNALTTNEVIKNITIEFYKPDDVFKTTEQLFYKIELVNASIAGYKQVVGMPNDETFKATSTNLYEEISIVFEKIIVTSVKGSTTATDDWNVNR